MKYINSLNEENITDDQVGWVYLEFKKKKKSKCNFQKFCQKALKGWSLLGTMDENESKKHCP